MKQNTHRNYVGNVKTIFSKKVVAPHSKW